MFTKDAPDLVADHYNLTSFGNISDALKKVWPSLAYGNKWC